MGALERIKGHGVVALRKIHNPSKVAGSELANMDKVYAEEILKSEGVVHAVGSAIKRHLHRHPFHSVGTVITTIESADGKEVNPVAKIEIEVDDPHAESGRIRSGVNVVWHTLIGPNARNGVARVLHSIHRKGGSEDESSAPMLWQDLVLPPGRQSMSLEDQIRLAVSRANGEKDEVIEIGNGQVAKRPAIELE